MFLKYPSLVNHYAIGKETRIVDKLDDLWYSTEKIHGANASYIITNNDEEFYAKRSGIIDFESNDKQFAALPEVITDSIKKAARLILDEKKSDKVIVYGEYFGKGVQVMDYDIIKENKKAFKVFDVFVHLGNDEYLVLGRDELVNSFDVLDLVPVIKTSTLRGLLKDETDEKSLLGGYKEGNVYKPLASYVINDGHRYIGVKHKTEKYNEVSKKSKKIKKSPPELSLKSLEIRDELDRYLNSNRVNNVLSHGDIELIPENIGSIINLVKQDAIEEFLKETDIEVDESLNLLSLIKPYSRKIAIIVKDMIKQKSFDQALV